MQECSLQYWFSSGGSVQNNKEWNGEAMTATKMEQISCKDNEAETTFKTANLVLGRRWIKKISALCPMILPWKHLTEREAVKKK